MADCKIEDLFACIIARELKDDDLVAFGLNAELGLSAAFLAQKLYAPNLRIRHGIRYERGIELNSAAWTSNVKSIAHELVEYNEPCDSIMNVSNPKNPNNICDTFFVSGMQIDKHGNTNLIGIKGKGRKFKVRGPGCIGTTTISQFAKKYFIFTFEHSKRRLVDIVDYVSTIGYDIRKKYRISKGPLLCITPLCVFDFYQGVMRIKSVHAHSNVEEVLQNTGFKPIIPKKIPTTFAPTKDEISALDAIRAQKCDATP